MPVATKIFPNSIGITGSPATGKKTIGHELSNITGLEFLSLNDFAIVNRLGTQSQGDREFIVDIPRLRKQIMAITKGKIVSGHLLPYVVPGSKLDFVAVLRCSPAVLCKRYMKRNYPPNKLRENLEAEMIGVIAGESLRVYGKQKLAEFDTTRTKNPQTIAKRILHAISEKGGRSFGYIDWLTSSTPAMLERMGFLDASAAEHQKG
ncbi:MAG: adenylate kinase family protein [Nitrososphaerales archaeon]